MKCVFIQSPHLFSVQYHAYARVAQHEHEPWLMDVEGHQEYFRMQARRDPGQPLDDLCALFVPSRMDKPESARLLKAFVRSNPGVIPRLFALQYTEMANVDELTQARMRKFG